MKMFFVRVVAKVHPRKRANLKVFLFTSEVVTGLRANLRLRERRLRVLRNQLRYPVLPSVVINHIEGPELPERDRARARDKFAGRISVWNENSQGQSGEVIARQE